MLDPIPVGDAIAAFVQTRRPPAGTAITDADLQFIWEGIITIIYNDLKANLGVEPGSFVVTGVMPGGATIPVTGTGGPAE